VSGDRHELRPELFRLLVRAGDAGLSVGELQSLVDRAASTVAFRLRDLVAADLVRQQREGQVVHCHADFEALNDLLVYLKEDCCRGVALPAFEGRSPSCGRVFLSTRSPLNQCNK
jgi:ArsR family transcriptional regulator, arsenate/arsenite/antimonite-responsive transcriptional repressor